ncbi:NAD(P)H oxidoreductase [Actinomadura kijaniata]|uniref:NAD(P)H oxidoreductase n=1 Tax=Actinomadura kijaniata TaxID=46161 RepID=UPI000830C255|nr:NAD(P)H oxidoreductase [Actinomadura kijaniata]
MTTPNPAPTALLVVAHPRPDSLTAEVARRTAERLRADGHTVDLLDLHAEGFDPRMTPADEPDWADPGKRYTAETHRHMDRVTAADKIVVVFPVWWFGPPAILKGWFDRVWNHGFAYGPRDLSGKSMEWIALAGQTARGYAESGLDEVMETQLRVGISEYCGIKDTAFRILYDSVDGTAALLDEL